MTIDKKSDVNLYEMFKGFFGKAPKINVGDVGIYQDVLTVDTINDGTHSMKYDIYIKVKAIGVYNNLVEIEIMDEFILNTSNHDVEALVKRNIPKYIKPKYIQWEEK